MRRLGLDGPPRMAFEGDGESPDDRVSRILGGNPYQLSSETTLAYNCVAWAAGKDNEWWADEGLGMPWDYWPESVGRNGLTSELVETFEVAGFIQCGMDGSYESGYDKIALFEKLGKWEHACRVCEDGRFWSKLGPFEDVFHDLAGAQFQYGTLVLYMIREVRPSSQLCSSDAPVAS